MPQYLHLRKHRAQAVVHRVMQPWFEALTHISCRQDRAFSASLNKGFMLSRQGWTNHVWEELQCSIFVYSEACETMLFFVSGNKKAFSVAVTTKQKFFENEMFKWSHETNSMI